MYAVIHSITLYVFNSQTHVGVGEGVAIPLAGVVTVVMDVPMVTAVPVVAAVLVALAVALVTKAVVDITDATEGDMNNEPLLLDCTVDAE